MRLFTTNGCGNYRQVWCVAFFSKPSIRVVTFGPHQWIQLVDRISMCLARLSFCADCQDVPRRRFLSMFSHSSLQWASLPKRGDGSWAKKEKNEKYFSFFLVLNPSLGRMSQAPKTGYDQLREPISLSSVLNSDELWQLFSLAWTILLPIVIYNLVSGIPAKYSKQQASFYSMQVSFRFHSLRCSEILVSPSICIKIRTRRFHRTEEVSNNFSVSWHIIDWCCYYYLVRNSLLALLEALRARIFSLDSWISVFSDIFFLCVCKVANKAFLPPLSTRLLCLVVAIPLVCWLYMCACVCVPLYGHVKMCR